MIHKGSILEHNLLESNILSDIRNSPFLVNIVEVKQFGDNIYIVMEYLPKGDLYFYTNKEGVELSDDTMRGVLA
jgi:serine/threonine protein kinase